MRKKNIKKHIWIDAKEDELLKKKSKQAGLSESEFVRSLIKGYRIKEHRVNAAAIPDFFLIPWNRLVPNSSLHR